jgi:hypothetical protein
MQLTAALAPPLMPNVRPDIRRKLMKQMNGPITKSLIASAIIFLLIATGSVFSPAEEKVGVSKVVFYVA